MSGTAGRSIPLVSRAIAVLLVTFSTLTCAHAQEEGAGAENQEFTGTWIDALCIYLAPTVARLFGDGYQPGAMLWLDVTDPLGTVFTTQVVADANGPVIAAVAVDEPGIHQTRIRDGAGQVLNEGELFVGLQ